MRRLNARWSRFRKENGGQRCEKSSCVNVVFRLTLSLGVAQQMSHGVSRVTDEAVTAQLVQKLAI